MAVSCTSDDSISAAEQAVIDNDNIIEFMKSNKLVDFHVGEMVNNIEWRVELMTADDTLNNVATLYDIMGQSYVDTIVDGVDYKIYYHQIENTGSGTVVDSLNSSIQVDYEAYYMGLTLPTDETKVYSVNFNLVDLYQCWQAVIPKIKAGVKSADFDDPCDCDPYRTKIDNPGKVLILSPSAMNGFSTSTMMFNIVLYNHDVPNEVY